MGFNPSNKIGCKIILAVWFGLTATLCPWISDVLAANPASPPLVQPEAPPEISLENVEIKIQAVKNKLGEAVALGNEQKARKLGVTPVQLQAHIEKLRDLEAVYQRLITTLKKKSSLEKEEALWREKGQVPQQEEIAESPPYSLSFYDSVLDQLAAAQYRKETANLALSLANRAVEDARLRLDESRQTLREFKEKVQEKKQGAETSKSDWDLLQAQLEVEVAQANLDEQKLNKQNFSVEIRLGTFLIDAVQKKMDWVRKNLHFDQADLEKQLGSIERTRIELKKRLKDQLQRQVRVDALWIQAQKRLSDARKESEMVLAKAALEASNARRTASQRFLEQTEDMLQLMNQQEQAWKNRYALIQGEKDPEKLDNWRRTFEDYRVNIERSLRLQESYQTTLQVQIVALGKQISEQNAKVNLRQELENQLQALRALTDGGMEYLSTLQVTAQLHERLLSEIAAKREQFALWKNIPMLFNKAQDLWNLELWVIDEHGVTVKKLVSALFFLFIGLLFVKRIVLSTTRRLLNRTQLKATTTAAFEKLAGYFTIFLIVLFALRVVNIPLTLFTFLGGAVAIGVGFGAQNLINNFISSFIIMAEQPIKIGDLIEIEGNFAMVEEIGARCTRIRTGGNVQILVPNSSFLEKNIINWTLSDKEVRACVTLGVIYGSPVREVERMMLQVANEHKRIKKHPEPFVIFNDFGDNALIFDLYFWISMNRIMDRRIIESDIRFRIDELFREAGVVIAFPQRDIHLDTQTPLELRIVNPENMPEKSK